MRQIKIVASGLGLLLAIAAHGSPVDPSPAGSVELQQVAHLERGADWVAIDGRLVAFGSGTQLFLAALNGHALEIEREIELGTAALDGALMENQLYLNHGRGVSWIDLESPDLTAHPVTLEPEPLAPLQIARMNEHLVIAEDGLGLRVVRMPAPARVLSMAHRHHDAPDRPTQVLLHPMNESFSALALSNHALYAAVIGKGVAVIDNKDLGREGASPRFLPIDGPIDALAINGERLRVLGATGLRIVELSDIENPRTTRVHTDVVGGAIQLNGRLLLIAGRNRGLLSFFDRSAIAATINVAVSNFTFSPRDIFINTGDSVHWENFGGFHNVVQIDGATETFTSGAPSSGNWMLDHTFTLVGPNPYHCIIHQPGMAGSVTVNAAAVAPPGVSDGSAGTPMTAAKLLPDGSSLRVAWDTTCPDAADHHIIHGLGSQLPVSLGALYSLSGSVCDIGTVSPFVWNGTPDPSADPTRFLWWLVVANDDATTEGPWGNNSSVERTGTSGGGSSGQCGITDKDTSNVCGQ